MLMHKSSTEHFLPAAQRSPLSKERSLGGYSWEDPEGSGEMGSPPDAEEHPEERIAFSLSDGRVGILSVKGRKV